MCYLKRIMLSSSQNNFNTTIKKIVDVKKKPVTR